MTKRIFRAIFIVSFGVFFASLLLFLTVLYDYFSGVQQHQLRIQTDLAAQGVQDEGIVYLERLSVQKTRITWIAQDGSILYDSASDKGAMENHLERAEVKEALLNGYGTSSRYSTTLTERYLYSAKRLSDGSILRLSAAQYSLLVLVLGMLQPICILFAAAAALSAILAYRIAKNIVKPLNELDLDEPMEYSGYDELAPLLRRMRAQQGKIRRQERELEQKKKEFDTLTCAMTEGLILLNAQGTILSINRAAQKLFATDCFCIGTDIQTIHDSKQLAQLLERAESGGYTELRMCRDERIYQVEASPVVSQGAVSGIVLLLLDITEKEKSEQMRREFTANVSHELKTPLHTISGSAELMADGLVKPEDIAVFSRRIYRESQRMIRLVSDIIKLSHLDEGGADLKREMVDLYELADETRRLLLAEADKAGVTLTLTGSTAHVCGIRQLLSGMIFNLCDNAVKYNRKGGFAALEVTEEESYYVLSVTDSGIGIPKEHQERIFERFYRVDKSHSKEIGGTGLGLSIVKHAARLHGAEIMLQSDVGQGTAVRILFAKGPHGI